MNNIVNTLKNIKHKLLFRYTKPSLENINKVKDKKKVVFTCVLDNYDDIKDPIFITNNTDYILYTDNVDKYKHLKVWKVKKIPSNIKGDNTLINRYIKMHPHILLNKYDYALYIDGNVNIISDITEVFAKTINKVGIAIHKHYKRKNIYQEGKYLISINRGNIDSIGKCLKDYKREGYKSNYLLEATILGIDLNNKNAIKVLDKWYSELVKRNTLRDQLHLPYILWKNKYTINDIGILGNSLYINPLFKKDTHIKKKVLFIANTDRHINLCHIPYIKMYKSNGYDVHVATNTDKEIEYTDKKINLNMDRNPYKIKNIKALFTLRKIIKKDGYDIITCHTPIGGFLARASIIGLKHKPLMIYTAHGFHFYKGSSIINWIIYYPIEKYLSRYTDILFTMNKEDYNIAKNKFHTHVYKLHGIGLDENRLKLKEKNLRKRLKLENKYIITYVAEISKRKNQLELFKVLDKYELDKNIIILLIGDNNINDFNNIVNKYKNVKYISFKDNIGDYINISDVIISPSKQEGLPQNILEALYFNKPIIATNIRGNKDLINKTNGVLVDNVEDIIKVIINNKNIRFHKSNIDDYLLPNVMKEYITVVNKYIDKKLK